MTELSGSSSRSARCLVEMPGDSVGRGCALNHRPGVIGTSLRLVPGRRRRAGTRRKDPSEDTHRSDQHGRHTCDGQRRRAVSMEQIDGSAQGRDSLGEALGGDRGLFDLSTRPRASS